MWEALNGPIAPVDDAGRGKLITVFSPKGGVGKTTLAVNLAIALTDKGARKVCLVDLDLAFGDVAITLQLFPAHTIADAVHMESGSTSPCWRPCSPRTGTACSRSVAPVQPDAKDSIPAAADREDPAPAQGRTSTTSWSTPSPAFDEQVLQAFDETDEMLLVTTLDVPTLKNVKVAVETLDLLNFPVARRSLILNRADDKVGLTSDKVESTLGMKISRSIPTSPQVANATNSGEPIAASLPRHPVSQAITALAKDLLGRLGRGHPLHRPEGHARQPDRSAGSSAGTGGRKP